MTTAHKPIHKKNENVPHGSKISNISLTSFMAGFMQCQILSCNEIHKKVLQIS